MIRAIQPLLLAFLLIPGLVKPAGVLADSGYDDLIELFLDWRAFESPPLRDGVPDYTATTTAARHQELGAYRQRLATIDPAGWPVEQQVDWHLVRAEMNGMDFNIRVLRPWARDPAFYATVWTYRSDTPAHEGPTAHALVELWKYTPPLSEEKAADLTVELLTIPPFLEQARLNLTGNARDLWMAGIKSVVDQVIALRQFHGRLEQPDEELMMALDGAILASEDFVLWLKEQSPGKDGPSGVGKDNYTWYLRKVHLVPLSWEEEVFLMKRELYRAHAFLKLEEHRNRDLPPLRPISSPEEYARRTDSAVVAYLAFLQQNRILPMRDYFEPALRAQVGVFVPEDSRNFFSRAIHLEPMTLWTHFYHWWDLARMEFEPHPSPVRRGPLLYNIFDSRAEGLATGMEEMMMNAGLYDDNPRVREIVYIMLAQRAARGLASLYAQANEFTMKEARDFHVAWTPHGWMREDLDLLGFEQQLYLRQPGYGTSYITGKYLIEQLLAERSRQAEMESPDADYGLYEFFDELNAAGVIPVSLLRWQMTGHDDEIRALMERPR